MFINPTIAEFKLYFTRDFPYGTDIDTNVLDSDISRAQMECFASINDSIFGIQETYAIAFNYLTAHYLSTNLKNSSQGINGQYEGIMTSKGVSSVSASYSFPQSILDNPIFSWLGKTTYGMRYLEIVYPLLQGQMFVVSGGTLA